MSSVRNKMKYRFALLSATTLAVAGALCVDAVAAEQETSFRLQPPKMNYAKLCAVNTGSATLPKRDFTTWDGVSNPGVTTDQAVQLAELYAYGSLGVAQDHAAAVNLLNWVLKQNDKSRAGAYLALAEMALEGHGMAQDTGLALNYLQKASELGVRGSDSMLAKIALEEARYEDAAALLRKDMYRGSASAALMLARLYMDKLVQLPQEDSTKQTILAAQSMLLDELSKGQCSALFRIGKMYMQGSVVPADEKLATQWMEAAVQANDMNAMLALANASLRGVGMAYDAPRIIELWTKAAQMGSTEAAYELGMSYLKGTTAKTDLKQAVHWLEYAANRSHSDATEVLIDVYAGKYALPADDVKYAALLEKASKQPLAKSDVFNKLAQAYELGKGVPVDAEKAFTLYDRATRMGNKKAVMKLARSYMQGIGVAANPKRSLRFFRLASSMGNRDAMVEMHRIYACGVGVEPNAKKAELWMGRALANDSVAGLLDRVEELFAQNTAVSNQEALGYLKRGVKLGDRKAMVLLGAAYMRGLGDKEGKKTAVELFKQAIADGSERSIGLIAMARQLIVGTSVPKDLPKAKGFLEMAVKLGDPVAQYELAKVLPLLEEDQKLAGEKSLVLLKTAAEAGNEGASLALASRLPGVQGTEWLKRAASNGSFKATLLLAEQYFEQTGNPEAQAEAVKWVNLALAYHPCDMEGQLFLAKAYAKGWNGTKNDQAAQMWFRRATVSPPSTASEKAMLAEAYIEGYGVAPNVDKAFTLYKESASLGNERAMRQVGRMYQLGQGVDADVGTATEWYIKAIELGDAPAMIEMGLLKQATVKGTSGDQQALVYFKRAADLGELKAMRLLGKLYSTNNSDLYDPELSSQWYEKAALQGDVSSMFSLVDLYSDNRDLQSDSAKVKHWVEAALKMSPSRPADLLNIADAYAQGIGVTQNKAEAFRLRVLAAKNNDPKAMREVARSYQHGIGVVQQPDVALTWFSKAAAGNDAGAMVEMGKAYKNGLGVQKDAKKAFEYFLQAAKLDETDGMIQLALCYFEGSGVAVNPSEGIEWFEKASKLGDTRAMMQLSNAYASGYGVQISSEKSLYWLKKAADGGSESARRQLDVLQRMKAPAQ